jgi:hypothetical protein
VRPDVPPGLAQLVDRCLSKTPDKRPTDAQEVLADLNRISGVMAADAHRETSGEREATGRRASVLPLVLAAAGVVALTAAGVWWAVTPRGLFTSTPPDTVLVPVGGSDSAEGAPLPARPMTRADSLAIAAALRDELARLDPEAERKVPVSTPQPAPTTARSDEVQVVSLSQQLTLVDSMVRIKLAELTSRDAAAAQAMIEMQQAPVRVGTPSAPPRPERRRVMVVSQGSRGGDSSTARLGREVAAELSERLAGSPLWAVVPPEEAGRGDREIPAEVLVTVGASRAPGDSAMLRIGVRNLAPGSTFGYNVITSKHFALGDGPRGYRQTMNQALEVLGDLRRVDRGQVWTIDMGRGPSRGLSPELMRQMDSMRKGRP